MDNIVSIAEKRRRHSNVLCIVENMYGEEGKRYETLVQDEVQLKVRNEEPSFSSKQTWKKK